MALNPIPLTTDPSNADSPKGAIPVDLFGGGEGPPGAPGFPTEAQWNDLVARVEALENA